MRYVQQPVEGVSLGALLINTVINIMITYQLKQREESNMEGINNIYNFTVQYGDKGHVISATKSGPTLRSAFNQLKTEMVQDGGLLTVDTFVPMHEIKMITISRETVGATRIGRLM